MKLSCVFAPTIDTPEHIAIAEDLGYERAWTFDTPQQSPDVFMTLARAAERTNTIGLGPGVLVPSLRHPMAAAAATATLARLAPGRVAVAFGTGFTGRRAMGQNALSWDFVGRYISVYRNLLKGEVVEWDGAKMKMFPCPDDLAHAASTVPILLSAMGPKGEEIARSLDVDGLMSFGSAVPGMASFDWSVLQVGGTVLEANEDTGCERVRAAAGPAWAINYHAVHDFQGGLDAVRTMPGGDAWADVIQKFPEADRHFAIHEGHLMHLNEADSAAWANGGSAIVTSVSFTGDAGALRAQVENLSHQGVTELGIMTSGTDIPHELEAYIKALA
ncbi:LLM class flavin-dependent oxidoreductase [Nocardioides sp. WG-D5]